MQTGIGTGFQPGEVVTGQQNSTPLALGTQVADANGTVVFTWQIPADNDLGTHRLILTGAESGTVDATFTVIAPSDAGTGGGGGGLAVTGGAQLGLLAPLGVLMLGIGAAVVLYASRRREEV